MKRLHLFVIKSYLGPLVITFAIALFILVMQFFWKYIDDLMGKGLDLFILMELLFYASANVIPMALPLAILLASIMTFGAIAEHNELTAMKSSGVSLFRIMFPLIVFMFFISGLAFYFSNYTWPSANFKLRVLISDIQDKRPALIISEGVFYDGIKGYQIRVNKKVNNDSLRDVLIYDHSNPSLSRRKTIRAEAGRMQKTVDEKYMIFTLYNGVVYEELNQNSAGSSYYPFQKSKFSKASIRLDLSEFQLNRTDEDLYKKDFEMQNLFQLVETIDSLNVKIEDRKDFMVDYLREKHFHYRNIYRFEPILDSIQNQNPDLKILNRVDSLTPLRSDTAIYFENLSDADKKVAYLEIADEIREAKQSLTNFDNELENRYTSVSQHEIEWHRKFTLSFACIILFFIGAPLGAIIRKGGLGMPVVVGSVLFILYYIISITGEKMAKTLVVEPFFGMWISAFILTPIGIFLTYKAANDSKLFNSEAYIKVFRKIFNRKAEKI